MKRIPSVLFVPCVLFLAGCITVPERARETPELQSPRIAWTATTGCVYFVERATFEDPNTWTRIADDISGVTGDLTNDAPEPALYRVGSRVGQ